MMSVLRPSDRLSLTYRLLMEANQRVRELERQVRDLEQRLARMPITPPESVFPLRCGAVIDPERRTITHRGKEAYFTQREWEIVDYLRQARRPVPKAELRKLLYQGLCAENAVAIHLYRIRGKLKRVGAEDEDRKSTRLNSSHV